MAIMSMLLFQDVPYPIFYITDNGKTLLLVGNGVNKALAHNNFTRIDDAVPCYQIAKLEALPGVSVPFREYWATSNYTMMLEIITGNDDIYKDYPIVYFYKADEFMGSHRLIYRYQVDEALSEFGVKRLPKNASLCQKNITQSVEVRSDEEINALSAYGIMMAFFEDRQAPVFHLVKELGGTVLDSYSLAESGVPIALSHHNLIKIHHSAKPCYQTTMLKDIIDTPSAFKSYSTEGYWTKKLEILPYHDGQEQHHLFLYYADRYSSLFPIILVYPQEIDVALAEFGVQIIPENATFCHETPVISGEDHFNTLVVGVSVVGLIAGMGVASFVCWAT